jgi:hypothetical protein
MSHEFDAAAVAYREAHSRCLTETGAALSKAQDAEGDVIAELIGNQGPGSRRRRPQARCA